MISANSFKPIEPVSSFDKFRIMRRLRKVGDILMTLHNVLMMEAPYDLLEKLFRKCCVRRVPLLSRRASDLPRSALLNSAERFEACLYIYCSSVLRDKHEVCPLLSTCNEHMQ